MTVCVFFTNDDHQVKELAVLKQILLCQHLWKCIGNSMENMHTDVRVERLSIC